MKAHYVYKITNTTNGKIYIGKSVDPTKRFDKHASAAKNKPKNQYFYLQASINKYGKDAFSLEVIEKCDDAKSAYEREVYWIDHYQSTNPDRGMNLTFGGDGSRGHKLSDGAKAKIADAQRGRKMPEWHRQKVIAANTGIKRSEETRKKMSTHQIGAGNHQYGKHHSAEQSKRVSEKMTGRIIGESTRKKMSEAWKNRTKLTADDIINIRSLSSSGISERDISSKFRVSSDYIHRIVIGKAWRRLL